MENLEKVMKFIESVDRDLDYLIDYLYQEDDISLLEEMEDLSDDISRVIRHLERLGGLHD
ncbi:hypothetical protein B5E92_00855 [Erysipelatoclostridium sp. An15]|uniref:hypothetical protein n=1 Tax=Erysipelatoclostridium sp. An15 TaxID=1965566 RepID=UPI000B375612|nr:hypothetical protein [Erysipelatoclostridium sp. An15]OUQ09353.1 hypothetical protein B5E92_00855 [Erysipelatoclostridium sp. An15]